MKNRLTRDQFYSAAQGLISGLVERPYNSLLAVSGKHLLLHKSQMLCDL